MKKSKQNEQEEIELKKFKKIRISICKILSCLEEKLPLEDQHLLKKALLKKLNKIPQNLSSLKLKSNFRFCKVKFFFPFR